MKGTNGLIKYTIEAYTIDEETLNESRGEKEIILLMPLFDLVFVIMFGRFFPLSLIMIFLKIQ